MGVDKLEWSLLSFLKERETKIIDNIWSYLALTYFLLLQPILFINLTYETTQSML